MSESATIRTGANWLTLRIRVNVVEQGRIDTEARDAITPSPLHCA
jgi:hypothetical protein